MITLKYNHVTVIGQRSPAPSQIQNVLALTLILTLIMNFRSTTSKYCPRRHKSFIVFIVDINCRIIVFQKHLLERVTCITRII